MRVVFVALSVLSTMISAPAQAQDLVQQAHYCENRDNAYAADLAISGCTALIRSGRFDDEILAGAFGRRGRVYLSLQDYEQAIADFDQVLALNPRSAPAFINRGAAYHGQGDYARAIVDYNQALSIAPSDVLALINRATSYYFQGDFARALADYDQAIQLTPDAWLPFFYRGNIYYQQGDYTRAIAEYDQAIRLNPQYAHAFHNRGLAYQAQGNYARAIAEYDQAGALDSNDASFQNSRCWARAIANRELDVARAACDASLRLRPGDASTLDSRGMVGLKQQRWQDAWNDYDAAVQANASHAGYHYGRGVAALRLGRTVEGQADIARATQLDASIARTYAGYDVTP